MAITPLVAIVGRPNAGKSTLFNRLTGSRQAITHEVAGTTRDANHGTVDWNGKHFLLVDTAGLQKRDNEMETAVQEQVAEVAKLADIIVVVADAGTIITDEDERAARLALKTGKPVILCLNKIDTAGGGLPDSFIRLGIKGIYETSAIHGRGTGDLLDAIVKEMPEKTVVPGEENVVRLALLGRPNVGKSSILNSLIGKQSAIVSDVAGTTRDVRTADVKYHGETIRLLDTAGLRRRGKIEKGVEKYSSLRTISAIASADICAVVIDATEPSVAGDQHIAGMVVDAGKGLILVVNKWDAIEKDSRTADRIMRWLERDFAFASWAPVILTSATQGLHVTKLFELTQEIAARRTTQIATGPLNRLITKMTSKQTPAGLKNRRPSINYATQTAINPPTFTIFSSHPEMIHFSYQRYLENGLRAEHDFIGTPIQIEFRNKRK